MKEFKMPKKNHYQELKDWEGRRALFKFINGAKAVYTIHSVEPHRPAFIVKIGNKEKELLLGGILSVKPIRDDDIIDGMESRRKDYKAAGVGK